LIDEYDKLIVDHIDHIEKATKNREILRDFFGVLKYSDAFLRFVFLTGVSKFSRVSIFSDLNNLRDLTFSKRFATLLGYTQKELESYFDHYIQSLCIDLEVLTDKGRIDGVLIFEHQIYLIEFKYGKAGREMDHLTHKALKKIKDKNYGERFLNDKRPRIYLGVGFSGKEIGYQMVKS